MTLDDTLRTGIADLPDTPGEPQKFSLDHNGWTVDVSLQGHDAYSGLLSDVTARRGTPLAETPKEWAGRLAENVTALPDQLKVHEVDGQHDRAWLRSATPTPKGDAVQYYEAELRGTSEVQLRRHRGHHQPGQPREQVPFPLTY